MNTRLIGIMGAVVAPCCAVVGLLASVAPLSGQEATTVAVENARNVPVVVYLERGMLDKRIGTVAPHSKSVLPLPVGLREGQEIQFIVHPEGGRDMATPSGLHVQKGKPLSVYVPTNDVGFVPPPPPEMIENPGDNSTTLTVENHRPRAVVVFIESGPFDRRIGTVPANETVTFQLSESLARTEHEVDVFVHVEGGGDLSSQSFDLTPHAHLLVNVAT